MQDSIANVTVDGVSLEQELLDNKLAYRYDGGKKLSWCKKKSMNKKISIFALLILLNATPYAGDGKSKYQLQTAGNGNNAYLINTETGEAWFIQSEYNQYGHYDSTARKVRFIDKKDTN